MSQRALALAPLGTLTRKPNSGFLIHRFQSVNLKENSVSGPLQKSPGTVATDRGASSAGERPVQGRHGDWGAFR